MKQSDNFLKPRNTMVIMLAKRASKEKYRVLHKQNRGCSLPLEVLGRLV